MSVPQKSFFLPHDVLDEIAHKLAQGSSPVDKPALNSISEPYADLQAFRLVSRSFNIAGARHLFRYVSLFPKSNTCGFHPSKPTPPPTSIQHFADVARTHPELLNPVEALHVGFDCCSTWEGETCDGRDLAAEKNTLVTLSSMSNLRFACFFPFISGPAFVSALHPDARLELVVGLSLGKGPLQLDGPPFQKLESLELNLDGDTNYAVTPSAQLSLPSSLSDIRLYSVHRRPTTLTMETPVAALKALKIEERGMKVASLTPFLETQGPLLTSLILLGKDLSLAVNDEWYDEPPDWDSAWDRNRFHDQFNKILPAISLCPNLVSLEIYDVHLPHLVQHGHSSVEVVILHTEVTWNRLYSEDEIRGDCDSLQKVVLAIQEDLSKVKFPQLKTIRYESEGWGWEDIFSLQVFEQWRVSDVLDCLESLGIEFLDGCGERWDEKTHATGCQEEEWSSDEDDECGEEGEKK